MYSLRLFKGTESCGKGQQQNILLYNKGSMLQQYSQYWIHTVGTQLLMTRPAMLSSVWLSDLQGHRGKRRMSLAPQKVNYSDKQ